MNKIRKSMLTYYFNSYWRNKRNLVWRVDQGTNLPKEWGSCRQSSIYTKD